ncbi:MAG: hypothetical protein R2932_41425 [Caldilineaceae bacterium]
MGAPTCRLDGVGASFVGAAGWLLLILRAQITVVPTFSHPWRPILQSGTNLYWVSDGWNWYIAGLVLLLGGLGILLDLNSDYVQQGYRIHASLGVQLGVLAAALLFVSSGNLLTAILTWVLLDVSILLRSTTRPQVAALTVPATGDPQRRANDAEGHSRGLTLIGAMLLLVALLPAGPTGPGQEFLNGSLPLESVLLLVLASLIRAGVYPFHIWLLGDNRPTISVAERLLEQMVPTLCGLWLLGWTYGLGREYILFRLDVWALFLIALLGSALAAWTAKSQTDHHSFVLVTSAGLAALAGSFSYGEGPTAMIWPTTAFALGGALWLVGEQVWQGWGWAIPVSVGALTLAGVPLTPGFLAQPALSILWSPGTVLQLLFVLYATAQALQIAALLRSWEDVERSEVITLDAGSMSRLLGASIALGLPLAVAGFLPRTIAAMASMPNAIAPTLGDPPSVVAREPAIWITLLVPLLFGFGLVWLRPKVWLVIGGLAEQLHQLIRLDWLFRLGWWILRQFTEVWGNATRVLEGAGYMGWLLVFGLIVYLMIQ